MTKRVYRTIQLFQPTGFNLFGIFWRGGWKVSDAKLKWEEDNRKFNDAIVLVSKHNEKVSKAVPWQELGMAMRDSYHNISQAIMLSRGGAIAEVVDMEATFGSYLNISERKK